ncbi:NUDIX domain-containing protein [Brevundimonas sp. 2R-24]|uniref:NUDIX domain-containing protein n=1 Tax=Peiella sedimenti TaxID=3061083 RepID=A0ABT8SJI3_9CAUL|nr:NUDIX domain-containing protein [Caulobacteraceae bacterium XZ-24]
MSRTSRPRGPAFTARQVGALPWRRVGQGVEVCLVQTSSSRQWLPPKGWPMEGKSDPEAAAQEAWEEAGVRGQVDHAPLGRFRHLKGLKSGGTLPAEITLYALRTEEVRDDYPEARRPRRWAGVEEAAALVRSPELAALIRRFAADAMGEGDAEGESG